MSDEMKEAAELAVKAKRLEALILRWGDEADRLLRTEAFTQAYPVRALLREIAEATL